MTLQNILILFALFFLVNFLRERRLQSRLLTAASILFVFALQPLVPIRNFDFWFPFAAIALSLVCWAAVTQSSAENPGLLSVLSAERTDFFLIFGCLLLVALTRLISVEGILTATRPPLLQYSLTAILILAFILIGLQRLEESLKKRIYTLLIILLLLVLILLKTPPLAWRTSAILRSWVGQSTESAAVTDLRWLGFSYIAFRLLSVVIDRSKGRRITASPGVFLTYVLFPATLAAGPIDRLDHFQKELAQSAKDRSGDLTAACQRIAAGLFKKFILADSLALVSLSAQNAGQIRTAAWAWLILIAYSFQIYFDFSGYSDIAIGLARIISIRIPENFNRPYLKPDIAKFWSNWHITLTQWIRSYVFNPMIRYFRSGKTVKLPQWLLILVTQLVTMGLIGLWHGVTLNFLIWGCWHAIGLFLHQLYADRTKNWLLNWQQQSPALYRSYTALSTLLTFLFVTLGWIWFVLPNPGSSLEFIIKLFGIMT